MNSEIYFEKTARGLFFISIFFLPLSPTLNNLFLPAVALMCCSNKERNKFKWLTGYSMCWLGLAFLILYAIGIIYNHYSVCISLKSFWKEAHRFLALFAIPLFIDENTRRTAIHALIWGAVYSAVMVIMQYFDLVTWFIFLRNQNELYPIATGIPYSIFLAFVSFIVLNQILDSKDGRYTKFGVLSLLIYVLFFINLERTGMLVFFALLILVCWQRMQGKSLIAGIIAVMLFSLAIYVVSPIVHQRINQAIQEAAAYDSTQRSRTSIGIRLAMAHYSVALIKQNFWFGKGTGGYSTAKERIFLDPSLQNGSINPENSYLRTALQLGIIGLAAFLLWLIATWQNTHYLALTERRLAQGLILSFVISNFCITAFLINMTAGLYFVMLTVLFGARRIQR